MLPKEIDPWALKVVGPKDARAHFTSSDPMESVKGCQIKGTRNKQYSPVKDTLI